MFYPKIPHPLLVGAILVIALFAHHPLMGRASPALTTDRSEYKGEYKIRPYNPLW
ncbi:MAG TPA: hypothetical protein VI584_01875 [Nitrospiria bacterium]|nr:hypothetical protein [Nitrospiria bacterium]